MAVLAPGNLLQVMFFSKQISGMSGKTFLEIGPGSGHLSQVMIEAGMSGVVIELSKISSEQLAKRFSKSIDDGSISIRNESFFAADNLTANFDLILSSMVLEHLDSSDEQVFIQKCHDSLRSNGVLMLFVPANPDYWGVEDEIAGHFRRYTRQSLVKLVKSYGFSIEEVHGLTWPLSNVLLPLSNLLVKRSESHNLGLTMEDRTSLSGHRKVMFKTVFPEYLRFIFNRFSLYPFYLVQRVFKNHPNSLILFLRANK